MDQKKRDLFAKAILYAKKKRLEKYGIDWEGEVVWLSDTQESEQEKKADANIPA